MTIVTALACSWIIPAAHGADSQAQSQTASADPSDPWQSRQLVEPAVLAKTISGSGVTGEKPLVLHVGFPSLYQNRHIAGAIAMGPASTPEGLVTLKHYLQDLPRDKPIILYCGCCPWKDCPNIRPAFQTLEALGFKSVSLLRLPHNFQQDWTSKGFPTVGRSPISGSK